MHQEKNCKTSSAAEEAAHSTSSSSSSSSSITTITQLVKLVVEADEAKLTGFHHLLPGIPWSPLRGRGQVCWQRTYPSPRGEKLLNVSIIRNSPFPRHIIPMERFLDLTLFPSSRQRRVQEASFFEKNKSDKIQTHRVIKQQKKQDHLNQQKVTQVRL